MIISLKYLFSNFFKISDNSGFSAEFDLCNNSKRLLVHKFVFTVGTFILGFGSGIVNNGL